MGLSDPSKIKRDSLGSEADGIPALRLRLVYISLAVYRDVCWFMRFLVRQ